MKDKKNILLGVLLVTVLTLSGAYAALATTLTINGTAKISAGWNVEIISIDKAVPTGSTATDDTGSPDYTATTATFSTTLKKPGDTETYTITVKNSGTLDAKLSSITWSTTGSTSSINKATATSTPLYAKHEIVSAPAANAKLAVGETATVVVRVYWDESVDIPNTTESIEETLKLTGTLLYVQDTSSAS